MKKVIIILLLSLILILTSTLFTISFGKEIILENHEDIKSFRSENGSIYGIIYENGPQTSDIEVSVYTLNTTPVLINSTLTDATGYYEIKDIPGSLGGITYNVTFIAPYGYPSMYNNSVKVFSGIATVVNFSYPPHPGSIMGHVGLFQIGVPDFIHDTFDVTSTLIEVEKTPLMAFPDQDGNYMIGFLNQGQYNVTASLSYYGNVTEEVSVFSDKDSIVNFNLTEKWPVTNTPYHEETNVSIDSNIVINFNETMDPNTINIQSFKLADSLDQPVLGTNNTQISTTNNDKKYIFNPPQNLKYDEKYTIILDSTKIQTSNSEFNLHRNYMSEFVTEPAPLSEPESDHYDWNVNNVSVIENDNILLNGNLTITSTGNLTLRNVVLKLNCTENGTYHIKVQSGGILLIENSNITTNNSEFRSYWEVNPGSNIKLIDTEVSNFGWNETYLGLVINADNSFIDNCTFTNCHVGVGFIDSESGQIINCTFKNNFYSIYLERAANNEIHGCEISDGISGIVLVNSSENNIVSCDIYSHNDPGIFLYYSYNNLIDKCTVQYHMYSYYDFKAKGIFIKNSWGNIVNGSKLYSNSNGIYIESSYGNVVNNCDLRNNLDSGINIYFSAQNLIDNCYFWNNSHGVTLWSGNDCIIENCIIQNSKVGAYFMNANRNFFNSSKFYSNRDGVFFNGKSIDNKFISCYIEGWKLDFNFTHEANVETIETVFDYDEVSYTSNSNITGYWYLHLKVNNSEGYPATNVSISIRNNLGNVVYNVSSDEDGIIERLLLPEFFATLDNTTYFSPYTVTAESEGLINITEIALFKTLQINLTLELPVEPEPEEEDDDDDDGPFDLTEDVCLCLSVGIITFLGVLLAMNYAARRRYSQKQLSELEDGMDKPPPGKVKCSECGAWVLEDASACPRCGETFEGDEFECPGCGALVPEDSDICLKCGKIFASSKKLDEKTETGKKKEAGKFYCSDCGAVIDEKDTFCPACGEIFEDGEKDSSKKLKPRKKLKKGKAVDQEFMCSMCGAQVSGGANRCPKCKTEFD